MNHQRMPGRSPAVITGRFASRGPIGETWTDGRGKTYIRTRTGAIMLVAHELAIAYAARTVRAYQNGTHVGGKRWQYMALAITIAFAITVVAFRFFGL